MPDINNLSLNNRAKEALKYVQDTDNDSAETVVNSSLILYGYIRKRLDGTTKKLVIGEDGYLDSDAELLVLL